MPIASPYRMQRIVISTPWRQRRRARWAVDWLHSHVSLEHRYERRNGLVRLFMPLIQMVRRGQIDSDLRLAQTHRHTCEACSCILYALGTPGEE